MRDRGEELRIKPALPKAPTLQQALLDDEVDLALSLDAFDDARFCRRKLFEDELVLLTSLQHPLADRKWVRGADLVDCDLLMLEAARENGRRVGRVLFSPGAGFRSVSYLPLTEAILEMVRAGLGVSILPMWSCWSSIARRDVAWARLGKAGLRRKWVGAYRRDSPLAPSIRLLLSILKQQGAPLQRAQHDQVLSA
jgi:LysR family transcriptional regulator for metE and metH